MGDKPNWLRWVLVGVLLLGAAGLWLDRSPEPQPLVGAPEGKAAQRRAARLRARQQAPPPAIAPQEVPAAAPDPAEAPPVVAPQVVTPLPADVPLAEATAPAGEPANQSPLVVIRDEKVAEEVAQGLRSVPAKIGRYADELLRRYDTDQNGQLEEAEWSRMRGNPRLCDLDFNGLITRDELAGRVAAYGQRRSLRLVPPTPLASAGGTPGAEASDPARRGAPPLGSVVGTVPSGTPGPAERKPRFHVPMEHLPKGLADWFIDNDADGDGQVTMSEFSASLSEADVLRFREYDLNGDGLITPQEFIGAEMTRRAEEQARAEAAENPLPVDAGSPSTGDSPPPETRP